MKMTMAVLMGVAICVIDPDVLGWNARLVADGHLTARATIVDEMGRAVGEAGFQQTPNGVLLRVSVRDIKPGAHAFHIHELGRCETPTFDSAGGHFAPDGRDHGPLDLNGPHAGDLPNVYIPANGQLVFERFVDRVTLESGERSLHDEDGSSLVFHAAADDYQSQPSGNAGARIACGVITR
jgi:superoxide dismutase, Cu-Zn family